MQQSEKMHEIDPWSLLTQYLILQSMMKPNTTHSTEGGLGLESTEIPGVAKQNPIGYLVTMGFYEPTALLYDGLMQGGFSNEAETFRKKYVKAVGILPENRNEVRGQLIKQIEPRSAQFWWLHPKKVLKDSGSESQACYDQCYTDLDRTLWNVSGKSEDEWKC